MSKQTTCCFTGHRPQKFTFGLDEESGDCILLKRKLLAQIQEMRKKGVTTFLTGMSMGVDIWAAELILELKAGLPQEDIRLIAVIPHEGQANKWSVDYRNRYFHILSHVEDAVLISSDYTKSCIHERNRYLVDNSAHMIAAYKGTPGRTQRTVEYAIRKGLCTGSLNMFAHQTNVDVHNRLVAYGIRDLGSQQRTPGMLVMTDAIRNRVAKNRERGIRTHIFLDEMHIFFANDFSASFFAASWKQFRKDGALATGITQNVEDCLKHITGRTMLANSEYLVMLNQAPTDRVKLAELLHISDNQLSYITNVGFGKGLLKCGKSIVPFIDNFPKHTKLYGMMSTKPNEKFLQMETLNK